MSVTALEESRAKRSGTERSRVSSYFVEVHIGAFYMQYFLFFHHNFPAPSCSYLDLYVVCPLYNTSTMSTSSNPPPFVLEINVAEEQGERSFPTVILESRQTPRSVVDFPFL